MKQQPVRRTSPLFLAAWLACGLSAAVTLDSKGLREPAAGLETLEDPADRDIPERYEFGIYSPGRGHDPAASSLATDPEEVWLEAQSGAVRTLLGPAWKVEPRGKGVGPGRNESGGHGGTSRMVSLVLRGPAVSLPKGATPEGVLALLESLPGVVGDDPAADLVPARVWQDVSADPDRRLREQDAGDP